MIETCTHCGAVNGEHTERCCSCGASLAPTDAEILAAVEQPVPAEVSVAAEVSAPAEWDWRREVADRLKAYRVRQGQADADDAQPPLPFQPESSSDSPKAGREQKHTLADAVMEEDAALELAQGSGNAWEESPPARSERVERVEIEVTQPALDFEAAERHHPRPSSALRPVAELGERARAGLLDAAVLLLAYAGILGLFRSLGGHFQAGKFDVIVISSTLVLFYAQYFTLFTALGGSTPGMLLRGLRIVGFDGSAPTPRQLLWRSFGYVISGGTALLGFLWASWDEDHLTWQDRISQTYITRSPAPLSESESAGTTV